MVASEGPSCVDTKADPQKRGCFCGMVSKKKWNLWSNDILYISVLMIFVGMEINHSMFNIFSTVLDCNLTVYSLCLIRCFERSFLLSIRGTISSKSSWVTGHYFMPPCCAMFLYLFWPPFSCCKVLFLKKPRDQGLPQLQESCTTAGLKHAPLDDGVGAKKNTGNEVETGNFRQLHRPALCLWCFLSS